MNLFRPIRLVVRFFALWLRNMYDANGSNMIGIKSKRGSRSTKNDNILPLGPSFISNSF